MTSAFAAHLPHFRIAASEPKGLKPLGGPAAAPERGVDRDAGARAREEAMAGVRAECESLRAADRAAFAQQVAENERRFAETTADVLVGRVDAGLKEIASALNRHVARALNRFLASAVRERALGELSDTVTALLTTTPAVRVKVSGPKALAERLASLVWPAGTGVEIVTNQGVADLTVTIDDTIIETRIAEWMDRLDRAVGEADA